MVLYRKVSLIKKMVEMISVMTSQQVCGASSIDAMKAEASKRRSSGFGSATHFNKGVRGNWKKKFTVEQAEDLNLFCKEQLVGAEDIDVDIEF